MAKEKRSWKCASCGCFDNRHYLSCPRKDHSQMKSVCFFCRNEKVHADACPAKVGTEKAVKEWENGYTKARYSRPIDYNDKHFCSQSFLLGYEVGEFVQDEINSLEEEE